MVAVAWLSLNLVGCSSKEYVPLPEMVGCPQFELINIPPKVFVQMEPLGITTVYHDANLSTKAANVFRNLNNTGFGGDHAYKDASIIPNDIMYEIMNYIGYLMVQVEDYNRKYREENNTTK